jgi:exoribonuclease R
MNDEIPGVLILEGNKTYGKKNANFMYKFISNKTPHIYLLVPFAIKNLSFNKCFKNKFVIVKQINEKEGIIIINLGDTDILENFYEYNLYCRNLHRSIKNFTKDAICSSQKVKLEEPSFEDRTSLDIISIDPCGSVDIDDAFGISDLQTGQKILSIYIANVPFVIDKLNLWDHLVPTISRVSSIYLPNKKISMLPNLLSDNLCSLLEGQTRAALVMDITLSSLFNIEKIEYKSCFIKVKKNYNYDEIDQGQTTDEQYNFVFKIAQNLNHSFKYLENVNDSHDVIAFLMILMNNQVAKLFQTYQSGIFRKTTKNNNLLEKDVFHKSHIFDQSKKDNISTSDCSDLPPSVSRFFANRINGAGSYCKYEENLTHKTLGLEAYVHITSPIRRMVDLLNMTQLQNVLNLYTFTTTNDIFNDWYSDTNIDFINLVSKNIRKIQNECNTLFLFSNDESKLNDDYDGYVIDCISGKNKKYNYSIYLDKPNLVLDYKTYDMYNIGDKLIFKIVIFSHESKLKQKVRLHKVQ